MTFYLVVGGLIVFFSVIYAAAGRNQFVLFGVGFMAGMFVAKILG